MKKVKVDNTGVAQANEAIAQAQTAAQNLSKNFAADLKTENVAQVTPGAGAEDVAAVQGTRKKRPTAGLASQLGVNV